MYEAMYQNLGDCGGNAGACWCGLRSKGPIGAGRDTFGMYHE